MRQDRGIALIMTLIMSVIIAMMVSAGLALLPAQRLMTGTIEENQQALTAAEAGIEYARTQLQANPQWNGNSNAVVIDRPGTLWVREEKGNVVGIVWSAQGQPSLFKLRFNYQNKTDDDPEDGFSDPSSAMMVRHPYISYNRLNRAKSGPIRRGAKSGNYTVDKSKSYGTVPRFAVVLYCEGLSGAALREVTPTKLEPDPSKGALTRRVVEAFIGRDVSEYGDAVLYGASNIDLDIQNQLVFTSAQNDVPPRVRTMASVAVTSGNADPLTMDKGEVLVKEIGGEFNINGNPSSKPTATPADSSGSFLELGWSQIDKAQASDAKLNGGTYVWEMVSAKPQLMYYDVEYDPAVPGTDPRLPPLAGTGTPINDPKSLGTDIGSAIAIKKDKMEFVISGNVVVAPSKTSVSSLSILVTDEVLSTGDRPKILFEPIQKQEATPILTSSSNIHVMGKVHGSGAITAEGNISVQGESLLRSGPDTQVALYSKGNISIEPIPPQVIAAITAPIMAAASKTASHTSSALSGSVTTLNPFLSTQSAGDVVFSGVVYAQGNFQALLGPGSDFHLRGVLMAYGGDSEAGEKPGSRTLNPGAVHIQARNTQFIYDSSFVSTLLEQSDTATLGTVSWRWF